MKKNFRPLRFSFLFCFFALLNVSASVLHAEEMKALVFNVRGDALSLLAGVGGSFVLTSQQDGSENLSLPLNAVCFYQNNKAPQLAASLPKDPRAGGGVWQARDSGH